MKAARRTTRLITALAFAGLMLGSSPLAATSLATSARPSPATIANLCAYVAQAIAFLEAHPSPLNSFLLAQLERWYNSHCTG